MEIQEREEEVYTVIVSIHVLDVKIENLRHLFDLLIETNKKSVNGRIRICKYSQRSRWYHNHIGTVIDKS